MSREADIYMLELFPFKVYLFPFKVVIVIVGQNMYYE